MHADQQAFAGDLLINLRDIAPPAPRSLGIIYSPLAAACSHKRSRRVTLMAAMAALQASAPPPVVVVWMKGLGYIIGCQISSVEQNALIGITPPPSDLATARMSGINIPMIHAPQLAGAAQAGLDFVGDQQHAVMPGRFTDARPEIIRRDDGAGLALDGLEQHGRHVDADLLADFQLLFDGIGIAKRHVVDRTAVQHADRLAIIRFAHHAQRAHRLAVESL